MPDEGEIAMEDLIRNEGCIISITHGGFIKRTAVSAFRAQRRGGKGVIGMSTREGATQEEEGDFVEHLFTATTHDFLMFFTESGRAYVEKVYEIPEMGRTAKGRSIANILELRADEKIAATIRVQSKRAGTGPNAADNTWDENLHIVFATRSGIVKKSNLSDYANVRKGGIIAIQIEAGDRLIDAKLTSGNNELVLITRDGMSLRFHEEQLRDQGRNTVGVWGIRPEKDDHVVALAIVNPAAMLLVAGENGIGKRTPFDDYRKQSRGGKGIITMKTGDKTGHVVGALTVTDNDELMLITTKGQMVRTRVKEIRETGRNAMGVKLLTLREGEKLQAIAPVVSQAAEERKPKSKLQRPLNRPIEEPSSRSLLTVGERALAARPLPHARATSWRLMAAPVGGRSLLCRCRLRHRGCLVRCGRCGRGRLRRARSQSEQPSHSKQKDKCFHS